MATTRADRFLASYRKLENDLLDDIRETYRPFKNLVEQSERPAVQSYENQLKQYGKLRNSIVHHEHEDEQPIADPREDVVQEFQRIVEQITDPPGLQPFCHEVYTTSPSSGIGGVVEQMESEDFSQMPVVDDGEVIAVLTSNTIARWVGAELHQGGEGLLVTDASVENALPYTERNDNYTFLHRSANLYEAHAHFQIEDNPRELPDAVLITHDGKASQSLLGIITPYDLADLVRRL
jgi:predicted transcriptional regulator